MSKHPLHHSHLRPLGLDTNAAQFARQGNPWDGPELTVTARKKARKAAKAGLKPVRPVPIPVTRETCAVFADFRADRAAANRFQAALGLGRAVAPAEPPKAKPGFRWTGSRQGEMEPLSEEAYLARLAMAMTKQRQGEERAARAAVTAELDRRAAVTARLDHRLAKLSANVGAFAEAMAEAFDA